MSDDMDDDEIEDESEPEGVAMGEPPEENLNPGHPLFPVPEGGKYRAADISWIVVTRVQNGRRETCPRQFGADELRSHEQLYELFGGGSYELMARNADSTKMTRRTGIFVLPGPSRPLVPTREAAPAPVAPTAAPPLASSDPMVALFGLVFQAQAESSRMQMQMMTTLMGTVVTAISARGSDTGISEIVKAQAAQNAELMKALVTRNESGNSLTAYQEGQAAGMEMVAMAMNNNDQDDKMLETLAPIMQAAMTPKATPST